MSSEAKKVALVTGGAKRVGRAIAERLLRAGYRVAITYYSSEQESEWIEEYCHEGEVLAIRILADYTEPAMFVGSTFETVKQQFGRLDVLVNNASIYEPSSLSETNLEQIRRLMAIHFESPLMLAQAFSPMLRASKGHVIHMVDLLAERPWPQYLAYSASKAALVNLTLGLARELAPDVTVNGIAPGVVEWPEGYPDVEKERYLKRVPLQRPGTPQDVAEMVHFLVTSGSYLTGQILRLDGGRSIT
jgi:pteridine reductase